MCMLRHQVTLDEIGLPGRREADRQVRLAHGEIDLAVEQQQVALDLWIDLDELAHAGGQPVGAESHSRGDLQRALGAILALGELGLGHRQLAEHLVGRAVQQLARSEEHTSELQSLMRISYAVFCLKKKNTQPE